MENLDKTPASLVVKIKRSPKCVERKLMVVPGGGTGVNFAVHNSSINNLRRGVLERVFYVKKNGKLVSTPKPTQGIFQQRLGSFKEQLCRQFSGTAPISRDQFVDLYWGRRRKVYEVAAASLMEREVTRDDAAVKVFGKAEKTNLSAKPDPVMRIISPRDPRYNVELGRYLKPLEAPLYGAVKHIFGEVTIFKGLNALESGQTLFEKWSRIHNPVAVGLDASRFDQHVSLQALDWEHSLYTKIYRGDKELSKLLSWQRINKCRGYTNDGSLSYTVHGTRMSGDMNTALGNCLIMSAMVRAYCQEKLKGGFSLANNGDDCVVILQQDELNKFVSGLDGWFLEMGFNMKVEKPVYEFEEIEFCQTQPVWTPNGYLMVRNPYITLTKDLLSTKTYVGKGGYEKWVKAVGDCGLALTGGIPIVQNFYQALIRAGGESNMSLNDSLHETGMFRLAHGMSNQYHEPHSKTRYSFWRAFKIHPGWQRALEGRYNSWTPSYTHPEMVDVVAPGVPWP